MKYLKKKTISWIYLNLYAYYTNLLVLLNIQFEYNKYIGFFMYIYLDEFSDRYWETCECIRMRYSNHEQYRCIYKWWIGSWCSGHQVFIHAEVDLPVHQSVQQNAAHMMRTLLSRTDPFLLSTYGALHECVILYTAFFKCVRGNLVYNRE